MFKKLLIPVDLSNTTERTFQMIQLLAPGAKRELLHVVANQDYTQPSFTSAQFAFGHAFHDRVLQSARSAMDRLIKERVALGEPEPQSLIIAGSIPDEIAEHAKETDKDLIVMSTHGRTGVNRWLMGSVTERLLRLSPCPVLVERSGEPSGPPLVRNILVAVDFSEHSMRALKIAAKFAAKFGAKLQCLHVWSSPYAGYSPSIMADSFNYWAEIADSQMSAFLNKAQLPSSVALGRSLLSGAPATKLLESMESEGPDLLVLGTHGYGGIKRLALGSVAEVTVRYASCSTLIVP